MSDTNFDPLWLYDPQFQYREAQLQWGRSALANSLLYSDPQPRPYSWYTTSPSPSTMKDLYARYINPVSGGIPPELKKEKPAMGSNYDNDRDGRSSQQKIDDEVRKAIEAPRIAAEIAKRVQLVTSLEPLAEAEVGTVVTYSKKSDRGEQKTNTFAAIKTDSDVWAVTGDGYYSNGTLYSFNDFLKNLTTGSNLAENVQVATSFGPVLAPAAA